ncbi:NB-ARC domain-containing disease resistance protein, partial [Prunus dulcis]
LLLLLPPPKVLLFICPPRPDIAYAVSVVNQFMYSPNVSHRNAVDRILIYLKSNPDLEVFGYTDADWAGSIIDRRSTSGYFTFVGEVEYRGMADGVCEFLWIRRLTYQVGHW